LRTLGNVQPPSWTGRELPYQHGLPRRSVLRGHPWTMRTKDSRRKRLHTSRCLRSERSVLRIRCLCHRPSRRSRLRHSSCLCRNLRPMGDVSSSNRLGTDRSVHAHKLTVQSSHPRGWNGRTVARLHFSSSEGSASPPPPLSQLSGAALPAVSTSSG
jgi:hypothetical protein